MNIFDTIKVFKKDEKGKKVPIVNKYLDDKSKKAKKETALDMGIFKLAEGTYESMMNAGIKTKLTIDVIEKEFLKRGMKSSLEPKQLAGGINEMFRSFKIPLKAEVRSKRQIAIIKYNA